MLFWVISPLTPTQMHKSILNEIFKFPSTLDMENLEDWAGKSLDTR